MMWITVWKVWIKWAFWPKYDTDVRKVGKKISPTEVDENGLCVKMVEILQN
jgi:hypothetical protein